jgi:hypothetical protein
LKMPFSYLSSSSICCKNSAQTSLLCCSWSLMRFMGTIFAQTFFIPKFYVRINCTVSVLIFSSSAVIMSVRHQSVCTRVLTFLTFTSSFDVIGCPGWLSDST